MRGVAAAVTVYQPPMVLGWTMELLAVAGFASGAKLPVVTIHDMETGRHHSLLSLVFCPAGIGALVIGGFLAVAMGTLDLSVVFSSFGFPIGMLVLILPHDNKYRQRVYISGIAICNMFAEGMVGVRSLH